MVLGTICSDVLISVRFVYLTKAVFPRPDSYDFYRGYFETSFELLSDSSVTHDTEFQVDLDKYVHFTFQLCPLYTVHCTHYTT